jgi:murein tripeptide amidase MpaA
MAVRRADLLGRPVLPGHRSISMTQRGYLLHARTTHRGARARTRRIHVFLLLSSLRYSYARHLELVAQCEKVSKVESLGQSLQGRELECVIICTRTTICWMNHSQHPGESMAEHFVEGLLHRLLGLSSGNKGDEVVHAVYETVQSLLEKFTFYVVPNMCPDGSGLGHLRTNACGANLSRGWASTGDY